MDCGAETEAAEPSPRQGGGIANLRPPSTSAEARELGRRGGIASGEARRRRAILREELAALLSVDGGAVAKGIAVAMCREAKNGNVGAFKAIAQVLGELKEVVGIETEALPPPIVLAVHDPAFVEAERERQRREFAEIVDVAAVELKAPPSGGEPTAETAGAAGSPETGVGAAGNAPRGADGKTPVPTADAPAGRKSASVADGARTPPEPPPLPRVPRTPSEAAAMRRAEAERQGAARTPTPQGRGRALPATFPKLRRGGG